MKSVEELRGLLGEAQRMPYGSAQVALVEQVVRHADAAGDRELAFDARMLATTAYVYGGETAKSFVTFSWCLSDFDREPADFHRRMAHYLLWHFKYMVSALTKFPEVPLERTHAVLDDMERRYRDGGHSLQAVYKYRFLVARHVGDEQQTARWYGQWMTAPRDELSDCVGCDPTSQVTYLADVGRDAEAIALAEPVLAGRLTCTEQPQGILSALLAPYVRTGRSDAAADAHRRAYRLVRGNLADLQDIGEHIELCARTGNEHRGLEILQRHLDWWDRAPSPAAAMRFAASAAVLLRRLVETGHGDLPVYRGPNAERPAGEVSVVALAAEAVRYATDLAARFDARNGTTEQSRRIADTLAAEPYPVVLPLSPTARRRAPGGAPAAGAAGPPGTGTVLRAPQAPDVPTVPDVPAIPVDADAQTLLELAEEFERADRDDAVVAVLDAFDERFGGADLGPAVEGRRADLEAGRRWADHDVEGAVERLEAAVASYREAGEPGRASRASAGVGVLRALTGDVAGGRALVDADVGYQQEHGDARGRAAAQARSAAVSGIEDRHADALAALDRAAELADGLADARLSAYYAMRRAEALAALDRQAEAVAAAGAAREFYRSHGPARLAATAALVCGRLAADPAVALEAFDEAIATGEPSTVLDARMGRGRALVHLDRAADAVDEFVEAVALCAERDLAEGGAYVRHELAVAYRRAGRPVEAAEVAEESVAGLRRAGHDDDADQVAYLLAGVYRELGEVDPALALYDELADRLEGNVAGRAQVLEDAGDVLFRADRDAQAAQRFAAAAEGYRAAGEPLDELRALRRQLMALHWADDVPAAERVIRLASDRHAALPATEADRPRAGWERVMLGFEAARMLLARGRHEEAVPHLVGGPERLRAIGADSDAVQVAEMLADALDASGRTVEASAVRAAQAREADDR